MENTLEILFKYIIMLIYICYVSNEMFYIKNFGLIIYDFDYIWYDRCYTVIFNSPHMFQDQDLFSNKDYSLCLKEQRF